jgi:hypothetical protein
MGMLRVDEERRRKSEEMRRVKSRGPPLRPYSRGRDRLPAAHWTGKTAKRPVRGREEGKDRRRAGASATRANLYNMAAGNGRRQRGEQGARNGAATSAATAPERKGKGRRERPVAPCERDRTGRGPETNAVRRDVREREGERGASRQAARTDGHAGAGAGGRRRGRRGERMSACACVCVPRGEREREGESR